MAGLVKDGLGASIFLPIVLVLIPASAFTFLVTDAAFGYVAALFLVLDIGVVVWADRLFERERLLCQR